MSLVIKNVSLLLGKDLSFIDRGFVEIRKDGIIKKVKAGNYNNDCTQNNVIDAEGFLIIPGFINAHTHIGDSIGKDVTVDLGLDASVHPIFGMKRKILEESKPSHLKTFIRSSALSMMKKGIVAFADFREGGPEGVKLLKDALSGLPIKCIILGRIEQYFNPTITTIKNKGTSNGKRSNKKLSSRMLRAASDVLEIAEGLGISGANENTDESLQQYRELIENNKGKKESLIAIHAGESKEAVEFSKSKMGKTEIERIIHYLDPNIMVHMTNVTEDDISLVSKKRIGIIVCPRANGMLGVGIPKVARMLRLGFKIGIGTDNVMINSPDIFREMDYLWKVSRATESQFINAKDILKMATVNGAEILRLNSGYIENGRLADIMFIDKNHLDLYPIHNPYASIVHRANQDSISGVMINGKFVDGMELL